MLARRATTRRSPVWSRRAHNGMTRFVAALTACATSNNGFDDGRRPDSPLARCARPSSTDDHDTGVRRRRLGGHRVGPPAQATKQTAAMLDAIADGATLEVPALWPLEVANALLLLVRRRKLAEDERQVGLGWLRGLRIRVDHEMSALAFSRLSELAAAQQLSVYDARTWSWRHAGDSCGLQRRSPPYRSQACSRQCWGLTSADLPHHHVRG
jgi:hypothetical protein